MLKLQVWSTGKDGAFSKYEWAGDDFVVCVDMMSDQEIGEVDDLHSFAITLAPHEGRSLLVLCPGDHPIEDHQHSSSRPSVRG